MLNQAEVKALLLQNLTPSQQRAVKSGQRRVLVVAGAGSGKTEVMARRIAWWVGVNGVPKERIVAFTFTERAAEEMKFRIRNWIEKIAGEGEDASLGEMYIGTIHGFCLAKIREFWPDDYHNYDVLDEGARAALVLRGFTNLLGLAALQQAQKTPRYATLENFLFAYDQLNEHNSLSVRLASLDPPYELGQKESEWCKEAQLLTNVGSSPAAVAFSRSAARYYAYQRSRRFLDFSTSQSEFVSRLGADHARRSALADTAIHLVVDEVQDINPIQRALIDLLVDRGGALTAVGDHRQAIYGFRGARVEIIAELWEEFKKARDAEVVDLEENFRSTPRVIDLANRWAATISGVRSMKTPAMKPGIGRRKDWHRSHVALLSFKERHEEAAWIADAINVLVPSEIEGALHDKKDGSKRGLSMSDIAILVRSSTDVRTYMHALEAVGIPCVVRAGPDLFSQPEVLFFLAAMAISAGIGEFMGSEFNPKSLPKRIDVVLKCAPIPSTVLREAAKALRGTGLAMEREVEARILFAATAIQKRIAGTATSSKDAALLRTSTLREFVTGRNELRRVFPQQIFHMLLSEAEVDAWDKGEGRGQTAMFHLGALSSLVTGVETPGWTSASDYQWQLIGLYQYGAEEGRAEEQPLMVQPDAVSISTIHGVKGLEFSAVFLADVCARRFPSQFARRKPTFPFDGEILHEIDVDGLSDNDNNDGERRLMYVALTRSERYLFVSHSGKQTSQFVKELRGLIEESGGVATDDSKQVLHDLQYARKELRRDLRIATSFSDLRYFLECPHDFYLRKVLGFAPTIDQAFGYGRGVHNLMRAVHSDPKRWADLAANEPALEKELQKLVDKGLFYLRYTTGQPASNMRKKGVHIVADYIKRYVSELKSLKFDAEKEFETLIEYEDGEGGALVSGAIDVIRQDNPPRVTLIDFKSGDPDSDKHQSLDQEEMQLQVTLYALAAKKELEYKPEQGLVRYLDADDPAKAELTVPLDERSLAVAKKTVARTAEEIRDRKFQRGPTRKTGPTRCGGCDFLGFCGMKEAIAHKNGPRER
jgi:DNA helicase-2/ATP-dependent DNA helicase PcrA